MLKIFWYRHIKHPILMNDSEGGIKSFTERQISENLNTLRKKITTLNANGVISEMAFNPEFNQINIPESVLKENQRKKVVIPFILIMLALAEGFLNYISTLVVIPGGQSFPILFLLLRLSVTLVLTVGSIKCFEQFFEVYLHERITELKQKYGIDYDSSFSSKSMILWLFVSLVFLLAVGFVVEKRASAIEIGESKDLAYYGLILISLILPVLGGMLAFEYTRARKIVVAAQGKRRHVSQIKQQENEKNGRVNGKANNKVKVIAEICTLHWNKINDFKSVKTLSDKKQKIPKEPLGKYLVLVDDFVAYQKFIEVELEKN
jgi:hypothetical protein